MSAGRPRQAARRSDDSAFRGVLLASLIKQRRLTAVVPTVLDILERDDPLASAGRFSGDLLRGLTEVPGRFWGRHPQLYERYRAALRAGASARRQLPVEDRLHFWGALESPASKRDERAATHAADGPGEQAPGRRRE